MVREVIGQVIVRISRTRYAVVVFVEDRLELAGVAAVEAVEVIKSKSVCPAIKRTDFAGFPRRRVVVLSEPRGCVTVLPQNLRHCSRAFRNDSCIAVIARRKFRDYTGAGHMMVTTREQCSARRRAQRGRMKAGIPQS